MFAYRVQVVLGTTGKLESEEQMQNLKILKQIVRCLEILNDGQITEELEQINDHYEVNGDYDKVLRILDEMLDVEYEIAKQTFLAKIAAPEIAYEQTLKRIEKYMARQAAEIMGSGLNELTIHKALACSSYTIKLGTQQLKTVVQMCLGMQLSWEDKKDQVIYMLDEYRKVLREEWIRLYKEM